MAALLLLVGGCAHAHVHVRPFPDRPVVRTAPDLRAWGPTPPGRRATAMWDAAEGLIFRRAMRVLTARAPEQSVDVNALDEVPDSSFFQNRIGVLPPSTEALLRAACVGPEVDGPTPPFRVVEVKPDGVQRGFVMVDARERRYVLKLDATQQRERNTAADVIVSALFYAAGYYTPCNRVIFVARDELEVTDDGPTSEDIDSLLEGLSQTPDGRWRASTSAFLGEPALGPWQYTGRWELDENDRVPHELRREVRAMRLFFAWVDHVDARSQNTLAYWQPDGPDTGYVVHGLLDFGDSFGATLEDPRRSRRVGYRTWVDPSTVAEDLFTLGAIPRRWRRPEAPLHATWGDFATEPFLPEQWTPGYWNGAFELMDEADGAWAARVIARIEPSHLETLVTLGRVSPSTSRILLRALLARRRAILERYLTQRAALTAPTIADGRLCAEDLTLSTGLRDAPSRRAHAELGEPGGVTTTHAVEWHDEEACVLLPEVDDGYYLLELSTWTPGADRAGPLRVHVVRAEGGWRLRGLERPARGDRG